jgi:putative ABC transport system permease protein
MSRVTSHKAWADLGRHRARTVLTVLTLALALASVATLAVPGLIDRRMNDEVRTTRLADVTLPTDDLVLVPGTLEDLRALPNVAAAEARARHTARVAVGDGPPQQATVWGVDVGATDIDVVDVGRGHAPGPGEVLVDAGNDGAGEDARPGDPITVTDAGGTPLTLEVSGAGGSLATSPTAGPDGSSEPVFYVAPETARRLTGGPAVDDILLRLRDASPAAADATVASARDTLRAASGRDVITDLPVVREPGDWPGRDLVEQITSLFQVVTLLAFVSALFLVANTMNTLIAEQGSEIAVMKAVGGRRRQVAGVFVRSALLVGVAGAVLGTVLGVAVASALAGYFTAMFGVAGGLAVDVPVVVASLVIGPLVAVLATLPALRRGLRRSVAEGLDDRGVAAGGGFGRGRLDRLVARAGVLPPAVRLGLRNTLRQRRRSAATLAQLTLAVGASLALLGLGASIGATMDDVYDHLDYDVVVEADDGAPAFDAAASRLVAGVRGVADVSPVLAREVDHDGRLLIALGFDPDGRYRPELAAGRWLTDDELRLGAPVAVLGPAAARAAAVEVGDHIELTTARGPLEVEVVGIDSANLIVGNGVFVPRVTLAEASGLPADAAGELWVAVDGSGGRAADHGAIDRAALAIDDALAGAGYALDVERAYVQEADEKEAMNAVLAVQRLMGLLIVGVSMLGLVNTITMGVIERTREIGVLRCLGARARDVRRALTAETLALVAAAWLLGVPVGWAMLQGLRQVALALTDMDLPSVYPPGNAALVLVGAAVLALGALVLPRRRAVRLRPGVALRYQ